LKIGAGCARRVAIKALEIDCGAKYPRATAKIVDDADVLLGALQYPADHQVHLRTTNPSKRLWRQQL
jgi:transposase-like protein